MKRYRVGDVVMVTEGEGCIWPYINGVLSQSYIGVVKEIIYNNGVMLRIVGGNQVFWPVRQSYITGLASPFIRELYGI